MEELFKDKYRIKSTRLKDWDYSQEGFYYITICTKEIRKIGYLNFKWQTRYYDHIIRDEKDFSPEAGPSLAENRIRNYIKNNPYGAH